MQVEDLERFRGFIGVIPRDIIELVLKYVSVEYSVWFRGDNHDSVYPDIVKDNYVEPMAYGLFVSNIGCNKYNTIALINNVIYMVKFKIIILFLKICTVEVCRNLISITS